MNRHRVELWILRVIEGSSHSWIKSLLYLLSLCFKGGVALRASLYDRGWKKIHVSQVPVVCVGNITAGGTGKTPLVEKLAQDLKEEVKLAIISTGYRSVGVTRCSVITPCDKKNRIVAPAYCGDEPFLLHQHLRDVPIFLSKDRKRAIDAAYRYGNKLVLLDDGLQNRALFKELVVIVLSARDLFGTGYYLPRGFLRESPKRLQEAHFLCVTGTGVTSREFEQISEELRKYSHARIIGAEMTPVQVKGDLALNLAELRGKKVGVFCGIGRPRSYMETLEALGVERVVTLISPDHCLPHPQEVKTFLQKARAQRAEMILCTEKDFVKITHSQYDALPVCYIESKLRIVHGGETV